VEPVEIQVLLLMEHIRLEMEEMLFLMEVENKVVPEL
jgi:hypothetical protein